MRTGVITGVCGTSILSFGTTASPFSFFARTFQARTCQTSSLLNARAHRGYLLLGPDLWSRPRRVSRCARRSQPVRRLAQDVSANPPGGGSRNTATPVSVVAPTGLCVIYGTLRAGENGPNAYRKNEPQANLLRRRSEYETYCSRALICPVIFRGTVHSFKGVVPGDAWPSSRCRWVEVVCSFEEASRTGRG